MGLRWSDEGESFIKAKKEFYKINLKDNGGSLFVSDEKSVPLELSYGGYKSKSWRLLGEGNDSLYDVYLSGHEIENRSIPEGLGLNYKTINGENVISLYYSNYQLTWNWDEHRPEIAFKNNGGSIEFLPVYMDPISKSWHLSIYDQQAFYSSKQKEVINNLKQVKEAGFN